MCGITGEIDLFGRQVEPEHCAAALRKLLHRGPDHHKVEYFKKAALGHARLSILDTSLAGNQPMFDPTGRYCLVFNGEIYNYRALARTVEDKGIQLRTGTDTEVLLHLLILKGSDCIDELNGFFAFCFYDKHEHRGLIARDRLGIKPLYYHEQNGRLQFSSELKSLLAYDIEKKLSAQALNYYFQLNYIPAPLSILKGVYKLKPGELMHFEKGSTKNKVYYNIPNSRNAFGEDYASARDRLVKELSAAVDRRMISDVPLGCFLSGGIDSSVISAIAAKRSEKLRTFSIGYADDAFYDETAYAEMVARHIGSQHTTFKLTHKRILEQVPKTLAIMDEPFADSSAIAVNVLSEFTRAEVTVALSGDGADELFAGYNKHAAEYMMRTAKLKTALIKAGGPIWNLLPHSRASRTTDLFRKLSKYSEGAKLKPAERYWKWATFLAAEDARSLLNDEHQCSKRSIEEQIKPLIDGSQDMNDVLQADCRLVLPNDMLTKVDRMSMAHALEVRTPFLDHKVVDLAFQMPSEFKITSFDRKRILKDSFRNILPKALFERGKHGFEVPLKSWMNNELKTSVSDRYLNPDRIRSKRILSLEATERLKLRLSSNDPGDSHMTLWAIIVLDHWIEDVLT